MFVLIPERYTCWLSTRYLTDFIWMNDIDQMDQTLSPHYLSPLTWGWHYWIPYKATNWLRRKCYIHFHVKLTSSEVERIPHLFASLLMEDDSLNNPEFLSLCLRVALANTMTWSMTMKQQSQTSPESLCASKALVPKLEIANVVMHQTNPLLNRIASIATLKLALHAMRTGNICNHTWNRCQKWMIGIKQVETTLGETTQKGVRRTIPNPAMRRFETQMAHLCYPRWSVIFPCWYHGANNETDWFSQVHPWDWEWQGSHPNLPNEE